MNSKLLSLVQLELNAQVRESDPDDPYRSKTVQLLDDFRLPSANGNRIFLVNNFYQ